MTQLRCFVAMRFGEQETDLVYEKLIEVALDKLQIKPVRIDRINHNENIDTKIMKELKICDFAIADLTFARPSVYFEAGFAESRVPVIYTCRRDHLGSGQKSHDDGFKVHFDLQMRNIIPWTSHRDSEFRRKLTARIAKVVAPLITANAKITTDRDASKAFAALSLHERVVCIRDSAMKALTVAGFGPTDNSDVFILKSRARQLVVMCEVLSAPTKQDLRWGVSNALRLADPWFTKWSSRPTTKPVAKVVHWILCTLNAIPRHRFHNAQPYLTEIAPHLYLLRHTFKSQSRFQIPEYTHLIDGIESEAAFGGRITEVVRLIKGGIRPHTETA
jgi:hypothetical protein